MLYFLEQCFRISWCAKNSLLNNFVLLFQNYTQKVLGIFTVATSESLDFGLTFGGRYSRYIMSEHFFLESFLSPLSMLELALFNVIR